MFGVKSVSALVLNELIQTQDEYVRKKALSRIHKSIKRLKNIFDELEGIKNRNVFDDLYFST